MTGRNLDYGHMYEGRMARTPYVFSKFVFHLFK